MKRISYLAFINKYAPFICFFRSLGLVNYHNREWIKLKFYSSQHDTWCTQPLSFTTIQPHPPHSPFWNRKAPFSFLKQLYSLRRHQWSNLQFLVDKMIDLADTLKLKKLGWTMKKKKKNWATWKIFGTLIWKQDKRTFFFFYLASKKKRFQNGCAYIFNTMSYSSRSI